MFIDLIYFDRKLHFERFTQNVLCKLELLLTNYFVLLKTYFHDKRFHLKFINYIRINEK